MSSRIDRRGVLHAGVALCTTLAIPTARACEFFAPNLRITHPWTRATGDAKVAIVSMKFDQVTQADRLIAVQTPVARRAAIGGPGARDAVDFTIPEGVESLLSETGTHLVLLGLTQPLLIARAYPLQLEFERGGVINASLSVDFLPMS